MEDVAHIRDAKPVLVVGGGIGGMALALLLRKAGRAVDLVEADPAWRVYGAGISITGPTFRAFKRLGLLPQLRAEGFFIEEGARICTPSGEVVAELPSHPIEADLPDAGGIMRPKLHEILSSAVRQNAVDVRLGVTVTDWVDDGAGVTVSTSDGEVRRYELVVAADGVFSTARKRLFPDAPEPAYTGQYCWRVVADRPANIDRRSTM